MTSGPQGPAGPGGQQPGVGGPVPTTGGQLPGPPVAPRPTYGVGPGAGRPAPVPPPPAAPPAGPPVAPSTRPTPPPTSASTGTRPVTLGATPRKGGRKARLTVKRIDPWSTLKFSFIYSLAGLIVLLVAVVALYAIVDAMGVIDSIRTFLNDVEGDQSGGSIADWLGFGRVMLVALVVGVVNVILFTAFATVTAFIYNVCTDVVGGVEVTLADRT